MGSCIDADDYDYFLVVQKANAQTFEGLGGVIFSQEEGMEGIRE